MFTRYTLWSPRLRKYQPISTPFMSPIQEKDIFVGIINYEKKIPETLPTVMSQPPKNSPSIYSWGKVGQLEYSFSPCLNSSFSRMFIVSKCTFKDFNICTTVWENPHCGKSLDPFINRTTFSDVMTLSIVVFSSGDNPAIRKAESPHNFLMFPKVTKHSSIHEIADFMKFRLTKTWPELFQKYNANAWSFLDGKTALVQRKGYRKGINNIYIYI